MEETRGGAPDMIYLPDQRQRTKKVTSGSETRRAAPPFGCALRQPMPSALQARSGGGGKSLAGYLDDRRDLTVEAATGRA